MARVEGSSLEKKKRFFVTRESQTALPKAADSDKLSYVGMRNLTDLDLIDEQDIVSARGTIRGKKNRVRAGLANFENPKALEKLNTERGKVVVYVTSFRGVRSTFEDCRYILDLFHKLRVRVVTRDIYIYRLFHKELEERLRQSGHLNVPQVFISGQHVGGKTELEELNEVGELRKILEGYQRYETANDCKFCGGFEFIPCRKCGGSKNSRVNKFTTEFRALRCTHCNEDGMEQCPHCEERRRELEAEIARKKMENSTAETSSSKLDDQVNVSERETVEHDDGSRKINNQEDEMKTEAEIAEEFNKLEEQLADVLKENLAVINSTDGEKDKIEEDDGGLNDEEALEVVETFEEEKNIDPFEEGILEGEDVVKEEGGFKLEEEEVVVVEEEEQEEERKVAEVEEDMEQDIEDTLEGESVEKARQIVQVVDGEKDAATLTKFICDLDNVHF